jgi:hypothetical protein
VRKKQPVKPTRKGNTECSVPSPQHKTVFDGDKTWPLITLLTFTWLKASPLSFISQGASKAIYSFRFTASLTSKRTVVATSYGLDNQGSTTHSVFLVSTTSRQVTGANAASYLLSIWESKCVRWTKTLATSCWAGLNSRRESFSLKPLNVISNEHLAWIGRSSKTITQIRPVLILCGALPQNPYNNLLCAAYAQGELYSVHTWYQSFKGQW